VEQVLVAHPAVADAAGVGTPHPDLGEQLVALVVPVDPADPPSAGELQQWCEERLSRYKCPRQIRLVATLDRNALGKLDKRRLRRTLGGGTWGGGGAGAWAGAACGAAARPGGGP